MAGEKNANVAENAKRKKKRSLRKILLQHNRPEYNITKAIEELNELSTELIKYVNKPHINNIQAIVDEIGDVKIRLQVIETMFGREDVKKRVKLKSKKFLEYITERDYKNV